MPAIASTHAALRRSSSGTSAIPRSNHSRARSASKRTSDAPSASPRARLAPPAARVRIAAASAAASSRAEQPEAPQILAPAGTRGRSPRPRARRAGCSSAAARRRGRRRAPAPRAARADGSSRSPKIARHTPPDRARDAAAVRRRSSSKVSYVMPRTSMRTPSISSRERVQRAAGSACARPPARRITGSPPAACGAGARLSRLRAPRPPRSSSAQLRPRLERRRRRCRRCGARTRTTAHIARRRSPESRRMP